MENIIATSNAATVTIRSDGNVVMPDDVTHRFWVDLYVNPSHKPGYNENRQTMACEGAAWGVTAPALPLAPGGVFTLTTDGEYYVARYSNPPRCRWGLTCMPWWTRMARCGKATRATTSTGRSL